MSTNCFLNIIKFTWATFMQLIQFPSLQHLHKFIHGQKIFKCLLIDVNDIYNTVWGLQILLNQFWPWIINLEKEYQNLSLICSKSFNLNPKYSIETNHTLQFFWYFWHEWDLSLWFHRDTATNWTIFHPHLTI